MQNFKKILILIAILSICITVFLIIQTYAKYLTATSGTTSIPVAKWNIVVNNQSIKNNSDISSVIQPIFPGNDNIASGIIAPTAEGYFDLAFDFSNVDVSFSYTITSAVDSSSLVKDLIITGYSIDGADIVSINDSNKSIEETILLENNIKERNIRIYIMWNDDPNTSLMNNIDDTKASSSSSTSTNTALFNVNIQFTQVANDANN